MFSNSSANFATLDKVKKLHYFSIRGQSSLGLIELVNDRKHIDEGEARTILVESFIGEYEKYLLPKEIGDGLVSWRDGDKSVKKYYEDYFRTELGDFTNGHLDYWIQATIGGKLVGWATFQREKSDQNAVYMNLLVVHPKFQKMGIGGELVKSLLNLREITALSAIHLLLRKKNKGGRVFYSKLGFAANPEYQRNDNFVDLNLLEGFTWKNLALNNKAIEKTVESPISITMKDIQPPKVGEATIMRDDIGTKRPSGHVYMGSFTEELCAINKKKSEPATSTVAQVSSVALK